VSHEFTQGIGSEHGAAIAEYKDAVARSLDGNSKSRALARPFGANDYFETRIVDGRENGIFALR